MGPALCLRNHFFWLQLWWITVTTAACGDCCYWSLWLRDSENIEKRQTTDKHPYTAVQSIRCGPVYPWIILQTTDREDKIKMPNVSHCVSFHVRCVCVCLCVCACVCVCVSYRALFNLIPGTIWGLGGDLTMRCNSSISMLNRYNVYYIHHRGLAWQPAEFY